MKTVIAICGLLVLLFCAISCGDEALPPPISDGSISSLPVPAPVLPLLDETNCEYTKWQFDGESFSGIIDSSYDVDPDKPGIQGRVSMRFSLAGTVPKDVRVVILQDGNMLRTQLRPDGSYIADASIVKSIKQPQLVLFQVYTYGWCRLSGHMALVNW